MTVASGLLTMCSCADGLLFVCLSKLPVAYVCDGVSRVSRTLIVAIVSLRRACA